MQLSMHWSDPSHSTPSISTTTFQLSNHKAGARAHLAELAAQVPRSPTSCQREMEVCWRLVGEIWIIQALTWSLLVVSHEADPSASRTHLVLATLYRLQRMPLQPQSFANWTQGPFHRVLEVTMVELNLPEVKQWVLVDNLKDLLSQPAHTRTILSSRWTSWFKSKLHLSTSWTSRSNRLRRTHTPRVQQFKQRKSH